MDDVTVLAADAWCCTKCGMTKHRHLFPGSGRYKQCKVCYNAGRKAYNATRPEVTKANHRRYARERNKRLRAEAIAHYGGRCTCCGEEEPAFLVLDHINNDGAQQRRDLTGQRDGGGSTRMYAKYRSMGWPDDLQLLCANCNMAKAHGGCPHAH